MFGFGVNQAQEFFIMQSQENKEKMIITMKYLILSFENKYNNNLIDLISDALDKCDLLKTDFTSSDWNQIQEVAYNLI